MIPYCLFSCFLNSFQVFLVLFRWGGLQWRRPLKSELMKIRTPCLQMLRNRRMRMASAGSKALRSPAICQLLGTSFRLEDVYAPDLWSCLYRCFVLYPFGISPHFSLVQYFSSYFLKICFLIPYNKTEGGKRIVPTKQCRPIISKYCMAWRLAALCARSEFCKVVQDKHPKPHCFVGTTKTLKGKRRAKTD